MTQAQQPEALRIAMHLRSRAQISSALGNLDTLSASAANELERQHARILELEQGKCLHQIAEPAAEHIDDLAVGNLAYRMKAKLAKQRENGYGGWDTDCTQERLSELLRQHVDKGDPVDVANFCAFLLARGEGIAAAPQAVQPAVPATNHSETPNSSTIIVPYGWKLVPDDATPEWVTNLEALPDWREAVGECIKRFLAAAPAHPAEGVPAQSPWVKPVRDLLSHISDVLPDDAFCKIDIATWNAVSALVGTHLAATQPAAHPGHPLREQALAVTSFLDHAGFDTSHLPVGMGAALRRLRDAAIATQPAAQGLTEAARSVLAERARQISAEGWTSEQDDAYNPGVLAEAGGIYALHAFDPFRAKEAPEGWPWSPGWWKPKDPRTNLVKAGALVLAEIERIDRTYAAQAKQGGA